mgnify:CR=1 FL=1
MEKKILVIGGGVIGLSSGICLLEEGWDVTIHSAEFSPNTTSDVAAALWYPFLSAPVEKTDAWGSRTYDILKLLTADEKAGIEMVQTFEYFRSKQENPSWMSTVDKFERITEDLPSDYVECFSFMTQVIEMPIYLNWLMERFKDLGGKLGKQIVRRFSDISDEFSVIINCTGLSSGELCNDSEVYPVRGQIIRIKPLINKMHLDQQVPTLAYIVPRSNDMILGGVAQEGNWNLEPTEEDRNFILKKCSKIIPGLENAEIIEDIVGLRPGRTEVRLEKEIIAGKIIIHNYGHGGSGVTLSWGCAEEVVEIVNE